MRIAQHLENLALQASLQPVTSRQTSADGQTTRGLFASMVAAAPTEPTATPTATTGEVAPINPLAGWVTCNHSANTPVAPAAPASSGTEVAPVNPLGGLVTTAPAANTAATTSTAADTPQPGIGALITAIMNGSFVPTFKSASQLVESTPLGNIADSPMYYASDQTAQQLADLLGGTVVQKLPFASSNASTTEIAANFIQLPGGQTVNAADISYYAKFGNYGAQQLAADLTQEINQGGAITNWNDQMVSFLDGKGPHPGEMPMFQSNEVGPAIQGMTYPPGTLAADGSVINPNAPSTIAT
jgi:hypothetical protein